MEIREVEATHTPNSGRVIWNQNDRELEQRLSALAINVRSAPYQAAGNGKVDDRPAIQAALNDASQAGGGTVYLPAGTYLLASGPLYLRNGVSLQGVGIRCTVIRLGAAASGPVITDDSAGKSNQSAFGRVYLSGFTIDGNREGNPQGQEGIFSTAYFSVFENLEIVNCVTHGLHLGGDMSNAASQNRVIGCRISKCGQAGLFLDKNAIDSTITQNAIYDCDLGVVINNGGIRLINNVIYNHQTAAVQVKQTSYDTIIALNDINGNRKTAILVNRTTAGDGRPWGQILISNNSILGNELDADSAYDAILVQTSSPDGISKLSIIGNKIFTLDGPNRFRYGIMLQNNVHNVRCVANHITDCVSGMVGTGENCSEIEIDTLGGVVVGPPKIPESGKALVNPYFVPVNVYLSGGQVQGVSIANAITGLTQGSFRLSPGKAITLNYLEPPSWVWVTD